MRVRKTELPEPSEGLEWSVRQRGDAVVLRLRERGLRGRVLATWSTKSLSGLTPDPETALRQVATQLAAHVPAGDRAAA